jgi:hypothetical protein
VIFLRPLKQYRDDAFEFFLPYTVQLIFLPHRYRLITYVVGIASFTSANE